jgi:hypothetical protein
MQAISLLQAFENKILIVMDACPFSAFLDFRQFVRGFLGAGLLQGEK